MDHTEKTKIAASDINYYIQARLGSLSDLSHSSDVLLLPNDFPDGEDVVNPYAMEISEALIGKGYKAIMAIGPKVQLGVKQDDASVLPPMLIMNMYKEREIRETIASWISGTDMPKERVTVTLIAYDASLVAYPAIIYTGAAEEVVALLNKNK